MIGLVAAAGGIRSNGNGDGVFWVKLTTTSAVVGRHEDHAGTTGSDGKSFVLV